MELGTRVAKMLQQLHEPNPDHPEKMGAGASRPTPEGRYSEILFPLPMIVGGFFNAPPCQAATAAISRLIL